MIESVPFEQRTRKPSVGDQADADDSARVQRSGLAGQQLPHLPLGADQLVTEERPLLVRDEDIGVLLAPGDQIRLHIGHSTLP